MAEAIQVRCAFSLIVGQWCQKPATRLVQHPDFGTQPACDICAPKLPVVKPIPPIPPVPPLPPKRKADA